MQCAQSGYTYIHILYLDVIFNDTAEEGTIRMWVICPMVGGVTSLEVLNITPQLCLNFYMHTSRYTIYSSTFSDYSVLDAEYRGS